MDSLITQIVNNKVD